MVNPDRFPEPLEQHLGFSITGTKLAASRFLLLGFCSLLRCNKRAAFLLRCSRLCLFLRRLLLRRLWRFVAHMLKLPPLVWQTRALNRPTFGIAPLTFGSQPCLNRGSQIGKTKLSVRKAEERHSKEGQEGRKEAPQAPPLRSISAYGGDEVVTMSKPKKTTPSKTRQAPSYPWTSPRGTDAGQSSNKGASRQRALQIF